MARCMFLILTAIAMALGFSGVAESTMLKVENKCEETIWPGILPGDRVEEGGFSLKPKESKTLSLSSNWSGRVWGRTGCDFDSSGQGSCQTGNCGSKLQCNGAGGDPPVTLVELTLGGARDFYDVSMVDGYNLPVSMVARKGTGNCSAAGACNGDLRDSCPAELAVKVAGNVVACRSACDRFKSPEYCCTGAHATPQTCPPTNYSKIFKEVCPTAYSYAYDDASSLSTCTGADYTITFCPSKLSRKNQSVKSFGVRQSVHKTLIYLSYPYSLFLLVILM